MRGHFSCNRQMYEDLECAESHFQSDGAATRNRVDFARIPRLDVIWDGCTTSSRNEARSKTARRQVHVRNFVTNHVTKATLTLVLTSI